MPKPPWLHPPVLGERGTKVAVYGQPGMGKTNFIMSACEVAKLFIIDTEGRTQYYPPDYLGHGFEVAYTQNVEQAMEVLRWAEEVHEKTGEEVAFGIDSFTGIWQQQQEVAEKHGITRMGTPKYSSWAVAKAPLKKLYRAIYATPIHVILTMHAKPKYDDDATNPVALGYDKPDTEWQVGYAVDLTLELTREELKPGTPLKPEDFKATVVRTSGLYDGPILTGSQVRDPSFSKYLGLRLSGEGNFQFATDTVDLQVAMATVTTNSEFIAWLESMGLPRDETLAELKDKFGVSKGARDLPKYIKYLWEKKQGSAL